MANEKSHAGDGQEGQQDGTAQTNPPAGGAGTAVSKRRAEKRILLGGVLTGIVALIGGYAVGQISGYEARVLLEATLPTTRFLCSAVMTATASILALMLTLLGLSSGSNVTLKPAHYIRVRRIAFLDLIAFIIATLFLLLLSVPVSESDTVPPSWFTAVYYAVLGISSALGGLLISTVLMLYDTVKDVIQVVGLHKEPSHMVVTEED